MTFCLSVTTENAQLFLLLEAMNELFELFVQRFLISEKLSYEKRRKTTVENTDKKLGKSIFEKWS